MSPSRKKVERAAASVGNYAGQSNERGCKRQEEGEVGTPGLKPRDGGAEGEGGLLAGCAISLASCPLAARLLCPARLLRWDLNWPRRLHLTPLPACSAHVYASQIPPGHGQTGRQAVAQRSAASPNKSNLARSVVWVKRRRRYCVAPQLF